MSRRLGQTLGSPTPWIFLFGLLAVGLMTEGLATVFDALFEHNPQLGAWVTVGAGILLLLATLLLFNLPDAARRWVEKIGKAEQKPDVTVRDRVEPRRGLIALVSRGAEPPAAAAIAHHFQGDAAQDGARLEYCWLLTGPDNGEQSSQANATALKQRYENLGVRVEIYKMDDADDPQQTFQTVQRICQFALTQFKLQPHELIADFTGGTKCMTAGMALACAAGDWDMQYLKPAKYDEYGRAVKGNPVTPILVDVDFFMDQGAVN
jgi:hypothetical protein